MSPAPVTPKAKPWLVDMEDSNEEQEQVEPLKKKEYKKIEKLVSCNSF